MLTSKDPAERPNFDNVPPELAKLPRWAVWEAVPDKKQSKPGAPVYTKIPKRITDGKPASSTSPEGWGTLEEAKAAYNPNVDAGLAFRLTGNEAGAAVVDIDLALGHTLTEAAKECPQLQDVLKRGTVETSPSGTGMHVWFKGQRPHGVGNKHAVVNADGEKVAGLEFYGAEDGRFMTFTGQLKSQGKFSTLKDASGAFNKLASTFLPAQSKNAETASQSLTGDVGANPYHLTENEIMAAIHRSADHGSERSQKLLALLANDPAAVHSYPQDGPEGHSSAEIDLMNMLAFWTGNDANLMDQIYRHHPIMRDKWDNKDGRLKYGERTIQKAIEDHKANGGNIYTPAGAKSPSVGSSPQAPSQRELAARAYIDSLDMNSVTYAQIKSDAREFLTEGEMDQILLNATAANQVDAFLTSVDPAHSMEAASTGFKHLDERLDGGLYPGLYVLGAISSLGKTTLLLQIADQIAAAGHDVILFSLEMSSYEIIAKSLSRYTYELASQDYDENKIAMKPQELALTVRDITDGKRRDGYVDAYGKKHEPFTAYQKQLIERAGNAYKAGAGQHLTILESVGTTSPAEIKAQVERRKRITGQAPIVIVDYLQIIAPADPRSSDKQNTDAAVLALKQLSRDENIPVFTISSFNRANYTTGVSMIAFKESGAIEYSSDVLIGLEFSKQKAIDEANRNKPSNAPTQYLDVDAEKQREPRLVDAKVLKNRNGETGGRVEFEYYAKFNDYHEAGHKETNELGQPHSFIVTDYSQIQQRAKKAGYI